MTKKLPLMLSMINAIVEDKKLNLNWDAFDEKTIIICTFILSILKLIDKHGKLTTGELYPVRQFLKNLKVTRICV